MEKLTKLREITGNKGDPDLSQYSKVYTTLIQYLTAIFSILGAFILSTTDYLAEILNLKVYSLPEPKHKPEPDWLVSLNDGCQYPLLGDRETKYIADIRDSIVQEAKSRPSFSSNKRLKKRLSLMKDNFKEVVRYLNKSTQSKRHFVQKYPQWLNTRNRSISELIYIARTLIINKKEAAATKGVGSCASLIGGLVCLATGTAALRVAGSVLIGLGSLAAAASSAFEFKQLLKKIEEAKVIIKRDQSYSEELWGWISDVSYTQKAFDIVNNINVVDNFKKISVDLHGCFKKNSTAEEQKMAIAKSMKSLVVHPEIAHEISNIIAMLMSMYMLRDNFRSLFKESVEVSKCYKVLNTACEIVSATTKMVSAVNAGTSTTFTKFQKFRLFTGIALDAISIVEANESFNSRSEEAEAIIKASEKLWEEEQVFTKIYHGVKNL